MRNKPLVTVTFLSSLSGLPGRSLLLVGAPGRSLAVKVPTLLRAGLQPDGSSWQAWALCVPVGGRAGRVPKDPDVTQS